MSFFHHIHIYISKSALWLIHFMCWCHFYFHSLIIISPLVSILAAVHTKRDEPKTIRHKAPSDTLWTEQLSSSLCAAAVHSGTFVGPGILANSIWEETFVSHLAGELEWVERILAFLQLQDLSRFVTFQMMRNWRACKSPKTPKRSHYRLKKQPHGELLPRRMSSGPKQTIFSSNGVPFQVKELRNCVVLMISQRRLLLFVWSTWSTHHWEDKSRDTNAPSRHDALWFLHICMIGCCFLIYMKKEGNLHLWTHLAWIYDERRLLSI